VLIVVDDVDHLAFFVWRWAPVRKLRRNPSTATTQILNSIRNALAAQPEQGRASILDGSLETARMLQGMSPRIGLCSEQVQTRHGDVKPKLAVLIARAPVDHHTARHNAFEGVDRGVRVAFGRTGPAPLHAVVCSNRGASNRDQL
jgi:hypothetical protein